MIRECSIQNIVDLAGDFRIGTIAGINYNRVKKWINQFEVEDPDKEAILLEMGNILKNFYFSRARVKECLVKMFMSLRKDLQNAGSDLKAINFVRTQPAGKSQSDLLELSDEILNEQFGYTTAECGGSVYYLYLDDCLYSGRTYIADMESWLNSVSGEFKLIPYHIVRHSLGYEVTQGWVEGLLNANNASWNPAACPGYDQEWEFMMRLQEASWLRPSYCNIGVNSNLSDRKSLSQVIRPTRFTYNKDVMKYMDNVLTVSQQSMHAFFRDPKYEIHPSISCTPDSHDKLEQALLNVGARLFNSLKNPSQDSGPMGLGEAYLGFGFGSPVITYRNISKRCPLAWWCSDTAGQWQPLFKRIEEKE